VEMNAQKRVEVSLLDGIDGPLTCSSVYHLRGQPILFMTSLACEGQHRFMLIGLIEGRETSLNEER